MVAILQMGVFRQQLSVVISSHAQFVMIPCRFRSYRAPDWQLCYWLSTEGEDAAGKVERDFLFSTSRAAVADVRYGTYDGRGDVTLPSAVASIPGEGARGAIAPPQ